MAISFDAKWVITVCVALMGGVVVVTQWQIAAAQTTSSASMSGLLAEKMNRSDAQLLGQGWRQRIEAQATALDSHRATVSEIRALMIEYGSQTRALNERMDRAIGHLVELLQADASQNQNIETLKIKVQRLQDRLAETREQTIPSLRGKIKEATP